MTTNKLNAKASSTEPQTETMPEAVKPIETQPEPSATLTEPEALEPIQTEAPETAVTTFPTLSELQAMPLVDDLANDWLLNHLQLAVALRVRQMLNSSDPGEQHRVRHLLETMTFTLAAGALHNGLQQAIAASKQSLQALPAHTDA